MVKIGDDFGEAHVDKAVATGYDAAVGLGGGFGAT